MARSIELQVAQSDWVENVTQGVRMRIQAVNGLNMPNEIFAYNIVPSTVGVPITAKFSHVCQAQDLVSMSAGLPTSSAVAFFRLDYVDLFLTSPAEAADLLVVIQEDVASLKKTLDTMQTLPPTQTITI